jgi:hypothetical protein
MITVAIYAIISLKYSNSYQGIPFIHAKLQDNYYMVKIASRALTPEHWTQSPNKLDPVDSIRELLRFHSSLENPYQSGEFERQRNRR